MGTIDIFGAPVSHGNRASVAAFGAAALRMLAYDPDPGAAIDAVLERDPDFIMGRCFRAGIYLTASDKRYQPPMARELARLQQLAPHANERERGHIGAIALWHRGQFHAASQAYADILLKHPRDLCALQFGHQTDFLLGSASSMRDRPARVLRHWSEADAGFPYILGMQAFGLEEAGHFSQAEAMAQRCLSLNPRDTWAIHALAHCYEMQGRTAEGIAFLERTEAHWARDNYLAIHNRWHLALYHVEHCRFEQALALHDRHMTVTVDSQLMDLHDSAAMLWRLALDGVTAGDRWEVLADRYAQVIDQAYIAFTDMHAMMAFVAAGRESAARALIEVLEAHADGPGTSALVIRAAGLPIVRGFHAFGNGDYAAAKSWLSGARHLSHLFGGSVAQRDVINLTLIAAAIRSHDRAMVEGLVAERTLLKPPSALTAFLLSRAASH
jgi:tetratricopeptide (TPR) repeat protein